MDSLAKPKISPQLPALTSTGNEGNTVKERLFHIHQQGADSGPFTLSQLRSMWHDGKLKADAFVWQVGESDWQPILNFSALLEPPRSPLPPSVPKQPEPQAGKSFSPLDLLDVQEEMKSKALAGVLAFVLPFIGLFYVSALAALAFLLLSGVASYLFFITQAPGWLWILAALDAVSIFAAVALAGEWNKRVLKAARAQEPRSFAGTPNFYARRMHEKEERKSSSAASHIGAALIGLTPIFGYVAASNVAGTNPWLQGTYWGAMAAMLFAAIDGTILHGRGFRTPSAVWLVLAIVAELAFSVHVLNQQMPILALFTPVYLLGRAKSLGSGLSWFFVWWAAIAIMFLATISKASGT
jgi:hypothetical protein